jgi:hypothetical protein
MLFLQDKKVFGVWSRLALPLGLPKSPTLNNYILIFSCNLFLNDLQK